MHGHLYTYIRAYIYLCNENAKALYSFKLCSRHVPGTAQPIPISVITSRNSVLIGFWCSVLHIGFQKVVNVTRVTREISKGETLTNTPSLSKYYYRIKKYLNIIMHENLACKSSESRGAEPCPAWSKFINYSTERPLLERCWAAT